MEKQKPQAQSHHTNLPTLAKGLKQLGLCLLCFGAGPYLITLAFKNKEVLWFFIPCIVIGSAVAITGIFLFLTGINTILKSMFKEGYEPKK